MELVLTGTGTSQGIPVIGCRCVVCTSADPKDKRLRTAGFIIDSNTHIAIDAGPDFRQQMLALGVRHLDALLITHEHNDHVAGLDDIRPFNFLQKRPLMVYTLPRVADQIRDRFAYIFSKNPYPGAPNIELIEIDPYQEFRIGSTLIMPFLVDHGEIEVLGLRAGNAVYITDANKIPERSKSIIHGAEFLVLNALHHKKHHAHFNLNQAIQVINDYAIKRAFLTHVSHHMGKHMEVNQGLPKHISLGFDGQTIRF